ncbi:diacylglycerol kinase (ATP) [Rhodopirellula rubra]|uniref:Diacylglycerol kinase (ATP) n=1 Tax=Aporhodopirellula rubra TaxID=980271 RepID=A0A7W5E0S1_9BACT|nr:diacylglycerol kinase family protein [Aporhodopirellula rubra]MBB3207732.1 diacylglycerol kinase (ATP) [Aporhodopirellula rubra]
MLRAWSNKFRVAFSGLFWAVRDQNSFYVHLSVTAVVLVLAGVLRLPQWQWVALFFAIGGVLTAELLNTAVELLVGVVHPERDPRIGRALDVAAAAVLMASITAIGIGLMIFGPAVYEQIWAN